MDDLVNPLASNSGRLVDFNDRMEIRHKGLMQMKVITYSALSGMML